jgi:hypothetical protein
MRARGFILSAVLAAIAALAFAAEGSPEQWLQYASSDQPSTTVGGTNGQQLKLTDKAPPGLALPKFKSDKPLFALWKVKLDNACPRVAADGGIWLAIDQSRKDGPYDLLYADAKAEGALAGASPVRAWGVVEGRLDRAAPVKAGEVSDGIDYNYCSQASFPRQRFTLPGADGPVAYHAAMRTDFFRGCRSLYVNAACWYEGAVTIGGRKYSCCLVDYNANTRFDDSGTTRDACDRIRIGVPGRVPVQFPGGGAVSDPDGPEATRYVGKCVEVGGKLHILTVSPDGAFVQFAPGGTLAEGAIRVPEGVEQFAVFGPMGNFICKPVGGLARVPAGEYMLDNWWLARRDAAGAIWRIGDRYNTAGKPVTVEPNQPADLDIGEPYVWEVTTGSGQSPREHSINVIIRARMRDILTMTVNGNQPPPPRVHITSADGKYDRMFALEYG